MTPLYALLAIAFLLVVAILWTLIRLRSGRLHGAPFQRRAFVSADEHRCLLAVSSAAGDGYQVFPRVAAASLLQPERRIGRVQRRLASEQLRAGWADLLICTVADAYPVCAVRLHPENPGKLQERALACVQAAFAAAGVPVVELFIADLPAPDALKRLIKDAIAMSDVRVVTVPEPVHDGDEQSLLSELSAAMQDSETHSARR